MEGARVTAGAGTSFIVGMLQSHAGEMLNDVGPMFCLLLAASSRRYLTGVAVTWKW